MNSSTYYAGNVVDSAHTRDAKRLKMFVMGGFLFFVPAEELHD